MDEIKRTRQLIRRTQSILNSCWTSIDNCHQDQIQAQLKTISVNAALDYTLNPEASRPTLQDWCVAAGAANLHPVDGQVYSFEHSQLSAAENSAIYSFYKVANMRPVEWRADLPMTDLIDRCRMMVSAYTGRADLDLSFDVTGGRIIQSLRPFDTKLPLSGTRGLIVRNQAVKQFPVFISPASTWQYLDFAGNNFDWSTETMGLISRLPTSVTCLDISRGMGDTDSENGPILLAQASRTHMKQLFMRGYSVTTLPESVFPLSDLYLDHLTMTKEFLMSYGSRSNASPTTIFVNATQSPDYIAPGQYGSIKVLVDDQPARCGNVGL